jgi:hypothetical protein
MNQGRDLHLMLLVSLLQAGSPTSGPVLCSTNNIKNEEDPFCTKGSGLFFDGRFRATPPEKKLAVI